MKFNSDIIVTPFVKVDNEEYNVSMDLVEEIHSTVKRCFEIYSEFQGLSDADLNNVGQDTLSSLVNLALEAYGLSANLIGEPISDNNCLAISYAHLFHAQINSMLSVIAMAKGTLNPQEKMITFKSFQEDCDKFKLIMHNFVSTEGFKTSSLGTQAKIAAMVLDGVGRTNNMGLIWFI